MAHANFPIQGLIANPTIDDYRTEVMLMEEMPRVSSNWGLWKKTIRRLKWMADHSESLSRRAARP